jgi:hypothetical protein
MKRPNRGTQIRKTEEGKPAFWNQADDEKSNTQEAVGKCSDARHPSLFKPSGANSKE